MPDHRLLWREQEHDAWQEAYLRGRSFNSSKIAPVVRFESADDAPRFCTIKARRPLIEPSKHRPEV
jgi:hypothetical protein